MFNSVKRLCLRLMLPADECRQGFTATVVGIHIARNVQAIYKQCSFCKELPADKAFSKITYAAKAGNLPRQRSGPKW
jgi:hypothetical protein